MPVSPAGFDPRPASSFSLKWRRHGVLIAALSLGVTVAACSNDKPAAASGGAAVDVDAPVTAQVRQQRSIPVSVQGVTDVGATVRVKTVDLGEDATIVDVSVSYAGNTTSNVKMASEDTYIELPGGQKLMLKKPEGNPELNVLNGDTMNGRLVFLGAVPENADQIFLVFNEGSTSDSIIGPYLRLAIPLKAGAVAGVAAGSGG